MVSSSVDYEEWQVFVFFFMNCFHLKGRVMSLCSIKTNVKKWNRTVYGGLRYIIIGLKTILDFILPNDFPTWHSYIEHFWSAWVGRIGSCFLCLTTVRKNRVQEFLGKCIVLRIGQLLYWDGHVCTLMWIQCYDLSNITS